MYALELRGLSKSFRSKLTIADIDLKLPSGEILVLLGPSGCGKTTMLRLIAGLDAPTTGDILLNGVRVNDIPAHQRNMAFVSQHYALYPDMTVGDNIGYPLKVRGIVGKQRNELIGEAATIVGVQDYLQLRPAEITRGQRQRVTLARSLILKPHLCLMDEPMFRIDPKLRMELCARLKKMHGEMGSTLLYVTHNHIEAMTLADRICILNDTRIQQVGSPTEIYEHPANVFVANFYGLSHMNQLKGRIEGDAFIHFGHRIKLYCKSKLPSGPAILGIRPGDLQYCEIGPSDFAGIVVDCVRYCENYHVRIDIGGSILIVATGLEQSISVGQPATVRIQKDKIHLFSADGNKRLDCVKQTRKDKLRCTNANHR